MQLRPKGANRQQGESWMPLNFTKCTFSYMWMTPKENQDPSTSKTLENMIGLDFETNKGRSKRDPDTFDVNCQCQGANCCCSWFQCHPCWISERATPYLSIYFKEHNEDKGYLSGNWSWILTVEPGLIAARALHTESEGSAYGKTGNTSLEFYISRVNR